MTAVAGHQRERILRNLRQGGLLLWFALGGGIAAWAVHLVALSASAEAACEHAWVEWAHHALTVTTAAVTLLAMWLSLLMVRHEGDDEAAPTVAGRTHFLGLMGLLVGAINVALILLEGSYVVFVDPCA